MWTIAAPTAHLVREEARDGAIDRLSNKDKVAEGRPRNLKVLALTARHVVDTAGSKTSSESSGSL